MKTVRCDPMLPNWMKGILVLVSVSIALGGGTIFAEVNEAVILLHGLGRTKRSMAKLEHRLSDEGFRVFNMGYPSRLKKIETLAVETIPEAVSRCRKWGASQIHFVTHSMGGILVRYYLREKQIPELGRVVMLSPPNGGSEVVDKIGGSFIFKWYNGPAGQQLGTDSNSMPNRLGAVDFELGIITGDRSINLFLSRLIPGVDDGKVAVEKAKVAGMKDFLVIHATHPFIMRNNTAMSQTIAFLKTGRFVRDGSR